MAGPPMFSRAPIRSSLRPDQDAYERTTSKWRSARPVPRVNKASRGNEAQNQFSQDLGDRLEINMTGGSDAHRVEQIGTAATLFDRKITGLDDLIRELKAGRFKAEKLIHPQEASRAT